MIQFYNTLKRKKEEFVPIEKGKVKIYTCGPTVYWFAHAGNFRAYVFADVLKLTKEKEDACGRVIFLVVMSLLKTNLTIFFYPFQEIFI